MTSGFVVAWAPGMASRIMTASPPVVPLRVTVTVPVSEPGDRPGERHAETADAVPVLSVSSVQVSQPPPQPVYAARVPALDWWSPAMAISRSPALNVSVFRFGPVSVAVVLQLVRPRSVVPSDGIAGNAITGP